MQKAATWQPAVKAASAGRMPDRTNSHWVLRRPGSARNWRRCHGGQARPATGPSIPPAGGRGLDCAARPSGNAGASGCRTGRRAVRPRQRQQPPEPAQPAAWPSACNEAGPRHAAVRPAAPEEADDRANVFDISCSPSGWRWPRTGCAPRNCAACPSATSAPAPARPRRWWRRPDPHRIAAVVSRGGRPDLAGGALPRVRAPTLLIVGGATTG